MFRAQIGASIGVGLAVSAVLFLPLVVWQYRRFGRFDLPRMLWTVAGFVYATALVAFTIFPLPDFSGNFCATHATHPIWDPLRFPKEAWEVIQRKSLAGLARSYVLWEVLFNVAFFVPLGFLARRVWEWPRKLVVLLGFGVSLLIETTQLTGNWFLSPCPYRIAEVTDLMTNTTGALVGLGLEAVTPRRLSTKGHLLALRGHARPITRARRLWGMVLDTWFLGMAGLVGGGLAGVGYALMHLGVVIMNEQQTSAMEHAIFTGGWLGTVTVALLPALVGTGASLGQRVVYLCPDPATATRLRCVLRAGCVQVLVPTMMYLGVLGTWRWLAVPVLAYVMALQDPRGLSYRAAGLRIVDARLNHSLAIRRKDLTS